MRIVTAAQMQAMDRLATERFGIPGRVLMENAGRGALQVLLQRFPDPLTRRVGVLVYRGNNGGDGLVVARCLAAMGGQVRVFLAGGRAGLRGDAAANLELLEHCGVPLVEIADPDALGARRTELEAVELWVDALFGTGLNAEVQGLPRAAIETLNALGRPVLAVDIPSGIDCDTGQIRGAAIRASATAAFAFAKPGHLLYPGADHCGRLSVVDIGIPPPAVATVAPDLEMLTPEGVAALLAPRPADSHKGRSGHLLLAAGAAGTSGAAVLAAVAALRIGAGLVTLALPRSQQPVAAAMLPEIMTLALPETSGGALAASALEPLLEACQGKRCLALGPGIGTAVQTVSLVQALIQRSTLPLVLDADGLNALARDTASIRGRAAPSVLTPHPGELARLLGREIAELQRDRIGAARGAARTLDCHVVFKGAGSVVADPDGRGALNTSGNAGMAAGGMGDVLTGIIAGLIAQGLPAAAAARAGVYLHGAAADRLARSRGPRGYLASEVAGTLPAVLRRLPGAGR
jgi:NAD(P)H-hydrate epimerase